MILVFLADGFELVEAMTPVDILRRANADVKTVSINKSTKTVVSSNGVAVTADLLLNQIPTDPIEMIVLPGGMPGAKNLRECPEVCSYVMDAAKSGNLIGAICAAPYILGELGLLNGKEAICYPGFEDKLSGAKITNKGVVRDGNIITAEGMGVALKFSLELVSAYFSENKAKEIANSIRM